MECPLLPRVIHRVVLSFVIFSLDVVFHGGTMIQLFI